MNIIINPFDIDFNKISIHVSVSDDSGFVNAIVIISSKKKYKI